MKRTLLATPGFGASFLQKLKALQCHGPSHYKGDFGCLPLVISLHVMSLGHHQKPLDKVMSLDMKLDYFYPIPGNVSVVKEFELLVPTQL